MADLTTFLDGLSDSDPDDELVSPSVMTVRVERRMIDDEASDSSDEERESTTLTAASLRASMDVHENAAVTGSMYDMYMYATSHDTVVHKRSTTERLAQRVTR